MAKASTAINMRKEEERWRAESDMRTLMECEEIKKDPKRLAAVKSMAKEKLVELAAVTAVAKSD